MAKWYAAHNLTPGDPNSLQACPNPGAYTDLVTGDYCFVEMSNMLHLYKYDSTDSSTQDLQWIVTPDGNAGNGRWTMIQAYRTANNGFAVRQGPPSDSTISFTDGTRTFSIQPTGSDYNWFIDGIHHTSEGDTVVITDVEGLHWIYYDSDGVLKVQAPGSSTDNLILEKCLVGNVYWDAVNNEGIIVGEERHGNDMSAATHYHLHESYGSVYESGLALANFDIDGSGDDATAAQFDVTDGEFHDEDIEIEIEDGSPQQLVNATIPTFYRLGVGGLWRKLDATANFPVADGTIGDRLDWNDINGGTWQLLEVANNDFVLTHYFATNDILNPIIGIMGQAVYANANQARTGAEVELASISLAGLPGVEWIPIATVIWQTSDGYSNQVQARTRSTDLGDDYIDWRQTNITGTGATAADHESLANLFGGAVGDHFHLTSVQETDLTDGGESTLHYHNALKDGGVIGAVCAAAGATELNYAGVKKAETLPNGIGVNLDNGPSSTTGGALYDGGGTWGIYGYEPSADVRISGTNAGSVGKVILLGNPDGATELYYAGVKAFETAANGSKLFYDSVGTSYGVIQKDTNWLNIVNSTTSGHVRIQSNDSTPTLHSMVVMDPDGPVDLYYDGTKNFATQTNGVIVYSDAGLQAWNYWAGDEYVIYNSATSGGFNLAGKDAGAAFTYLLRADPDGSVDLYYDGVKTVNTITGGLQIGAGNMYVTDDGTDLKVSSSNSKPLYLYNASHAEAMVKAIPNGAVELYYNGVKVVESFSNLTSNGGIIVHDHAGAREGYFVMNNLDQLAVHNAETSGTTVISGVDSGAAYSLMMKLDPDGPVDLYYDGIKTVATTATGLDTAFANEWSRAQNFNQTALTDAATIAWNVGTNQVTSVIITANRTMGLPTNLKSGAWYTLTIVQNGTGGWTMGFHANFIFEGGSVPAIASGANERTIMTFLSDGTYLYGGVVFKEN